MTVYDERLMARLDMMALGHTNPGSLEIRTKTDTMETCNQDWSWSYHTTTQVRHLVQLNKNVKKII